MATKDELDLEYHVTFPTPTPGSDIRPGTGIEGQIQRCETAVMLVGWLGCKDQYLAKYSKIYEDKGCTTVRYSTGPDDLVPTRTRIVAKKLLEVLIEMNLADNPVLFHIFSNGGSTIYNEMRKELAENPYFEEIDKLGIIYDSAPGRVSISRSADIMYSLYPQGFITTMMKTTHMFLLLVLKGLRFVLQPIGLATILPPTIYEDMMFGQDGCPELYLYSEADEVISYKDVEEIITRRHMQSVDISSKRWLDSRHVQHFRQHPKEYSAECYKFLSKCLQRAEEGNQ